MKRSIAATQINNVSNSGVGAPKAFTIPYRDPQPSGSLSVPSGQPKALKPIRIKLKIK